MSADNTVFTLTYYHKNKKRLDAYRKSWYRKNIKWQRERTRNYQRKRAVRIAETSKIIRNKRKTEVMKHYGNGYAKCVNCKERRLAALSIDHINGGGCKHRKELKNIRGVAFYNWLIKNNFPKGYQTLCMNCQFVKREKQKEWRKIEFR